MSSTSRHPPLEGITVVALEQAVAAPLATRHLADLGARVVKIERPDGGDFARGYDDAVTGWSSFFVWLNRGKESLTLDVKHERGREVLGRLLDTADVFVHNLAPGAVERLGFGTAAVARRWPSLVTATVTGYGTEGPWQDRKAYDLLVQAEVGLVAATGTPDEMAKVPISVADIAAGTHLLTGILAALYLRQRTGQAVPVEVSLFDSLAEWMSAPLYFAMGSGAAPRRSGVQHATIAPYGAYRAADGVPVMVAVQNEREWEALCTEVLGRPELTGDPRFAGNTARVAHRAELDAVLAAHCAGRSSARLAGELRAAGVATACITPLTDVADHPVLTERHRWTVVDVGGRQVPSLRSPLDCGAFPVSDRPAGVPALGQHTDQVLGRLGLSAEAVRQLRSAGVV